MLYGDPTEVLREGRDIVKLTDDEEDPRGIGNLTGIIPNPAMAVLQSKGIQ